MGCVLHATSSITSFKSLIQNIGLETYRLIDKEEENNKHKNKYYCFSSIVSEADWTNTNRQLDDIKRYILKNFRKLKQIKENVENLEWKFDIPIESRLGKRVLVQCDYIDVELIRLCAELSIGIEISYYPKAKEPLLKWIARKFRLTTAST